MTELNQLALNLKSLHRPGQPLVLTNVYDILSAEAVASLPSCKALATASYAVARTWGTEDDDMTMETNFAAVDGIEKAARKFGKPLTVDLQDGYGDKLDQAIKGLIDRGVVGANLEDCDKETQRMYSPERAAERVERAVEVARSAGVSDFVLNARCDTLIHGGEIEEVVERGKKYLAAGATTVFVWGGSKRGLSREEVAHLVEAFGGRLNVSLKMAANGLTVSQLANIGVARISVGPQIQIRAMKVFANEADLLLQEALAP